MRTKFLALTALVAGSWWGPANADIYHYRNNLIGEQASGLGGAFIAVSDDPSGVYYNPAGIVFGMENYFSLSANAYSQSVRVYKDVIAGQDYTYRSSGLVPTFFGLTQTVGKGKLGFAIIVPNQDSFDQSDEIRNISTAPTGAQTFRRRFFDLDRTYLIGPAYALEASKDLTVGISVLAAYRTRRTIDNQMIIFNNSRYVVDEFTSEQESYGVYTKLGLQYMPMPKFSIGATLAKVTTVQTDRHIRTIDVDSNNTSNPTDKNYYDKPRFIAPWETGLGLAYFPSKRRLYTFDFNYYTADTSAPDYEVQATWNLALGTEQYVTESTALRVGLFTNNANTPKVGAGVNQRDHVDIYGVSTALSLRNPGSSVTMGLTYTMGQGQGQVIGDTANVNTVDEKGLSIYLIGSYQL